MMTNNTSTDATFGGACNILIKKPIKCDQERAYPYIKLTRRVN